MDFQCKMVRRSSLVRPQRNVCVYGHMCQKIYGRSALLFLSAKPEIVVPESNSGKPSFVETVL